MKKVVALLLALIMTISLVACSSPKTESSVDEDSSVSEESTQSTNKPTASLGIFGKTGTVTDAVIYDENNIRITATGINYSNNAAELELTLENNTDKDLSFTSGSMGYSCNSVNGYMLSDGYLNCNVAAGKKANNSISFNYNSLMLYGILKIADIEVGFDITDNDYNHTYTGPRQVKTSAADSYDYSKNYYIAAITSDEAQEVFDYSMPYFAEDKIYDQNGISVVSEGVMVNKDGETALLLEVVNNSADSIFLTTNNISINGISVYGSTWSSDSVNPWKHCIIDVNLSSVLDESYWDAYGIKEVGSIGLSLNLKDKDYNDISSPQELNIVVLKTDASIDLTGTEVYNANGVQILFKTLVADSSEYSNDMYVMLLAINNSGKDISIVDEYDSLSVNGFMSDYSFSSMDIEDGGCAILIISLSESSLEDNKITSVSDVTDVEIGLEIKEGHNSIDEPTVTINYK